MENKKLITILGCILIGATILFTGIPYIGDFYLILKGKKTDFTFKHNYYVLGAGMVVGVLMVISPQTLLNLINKVVSSKLPPSNEKPTV